MKARGQATVATHASRTPLDEPEPLAVPLQLSSAYGFPDLESLLDASKGKKTPWTFYRRYGHPVGRELEETVAALEGTEDALACASGMSAVATILLALTKKGDRIVASRELYGGTHAFLRDVLPRTGALVGFTPLEGLADEIRRGANLALVETVSNPLIRVADLAGIAKACDRAGALLVVDNTFATPVLCRPARWGASVVFHSATKFLNGHGDAMGGIVCGPSDLIGRMRKLAIVLGTAMSPLDAWLTLRGLRTLSLRVERASRNAEALARVLAKHPKVARVFYPKSPKVLAPWRGAMLSFELKGGLAAADRVVRSSKLIRLVPSLGDVTTTYSHPARSSHAALTAEERAALGVTDGLLRISTGIEDVEDLIEDLALGLNRA